MLRAQPVSVTKEASPSAIFMTNPQVSFAKTTPPIRIEYPLFVLSLASRFFYPWRGTEVDLHHPLSPTFLCSIAGEQNQKKKIGTNMQLWKWMLIPDSKGTTFTNMSFFFERCDKWSLRLNIKNVLSFLLRCQRHGPRRWKESGWILTTTDDGECVKETEGESSTLMIMSGDPN